MYLRCRRCTVCIGPGFINTEIWYDPIIKKRVCRSCGEANEASGAFRTMTADELVNSGGGTTLTNILKLKEKEGTKKKK